MAGREKIKVYEYEMNRGKLFKVHESLVDCSNDLGKSIRPLFQYKDFHITERDTVLFRSKKSREEIFFAIEKDKNKLIPLSDDKPVLLMNMENVEVAKFASAYIAAVITKESIGTIINSCNRKTNSIPKNKNRTYWKYKE